MTRSITGHFAQGTLAPTGCARAEIIPGGEFRLQVDGYPAPAAVQWRKDGYPIPGATGREFRVAKSTANDAGGYTALVIEADGSARELTAITLSINPRFAFAA